MPKVLLPYVLANGNPADAAEVQANLDAIQAVANAIDDDNVAPEGIQEIRDSGAVVLQMDVSAGHSHDGTDAREVAAPTTTRRGGLKYKIVDVDPAPAGWTAELNAGSLDVVHAVLPLWTDSFTGANNHIDSAPPGYAGAVRDLFSDKVVSTAGGFTAGCYAAIDDSVTPNRVWLYCLATEAVRVLLLGT